MVKKNATDRKKGGGKKAAKKSAIKVSLLRLPVKKGEAQRSYKALEAKRAKDMKKAAAQRRRQAKQAAQRATEEASNFDKCQNKMKGRWKARAPTSMKGLTNAMPKPAFGIIEKPAVPQGAFVEFDRNCAPGVRRFGGYGLAENVKGVGGQTTVDIRVAAGGVDEGTLHKGVPLTELTVLPAAKDYKMADRSCKPKRFSFVDSPLSLPPDVVCAARTTLKDSLTHGHRYSMAVGFRRTEVMGQSVNLNARLTRMEKIACYSDIKELRMVRTLGGTVTYAQGQKTKRGKGGMFEATAKSGALTMRFLLETGWGVSVNSGRRFAEARQSQSFIIIV